MKTFLTQLRIHEDVVSWVKSVQIAVDIARGEILAGLRSKSESELQKTTFVGNAEFLRSINPDKIGSLGIGIEISQLTQSNLPFVSISVQELKDHEVHAKEPPQTSCVRLPVIRKNLTTQTRSPGDSIPSINRSGRNSEQQVIDLTQDGLNTSVSVEASSLNKPDSSHEVNSISDQDKENMTLKTQHRPNSPVYGKLTSRLSYLHLHALFHKIGSLFRLLT